MPTCKTYDLGLWDCMVRPNRLGTSLESVSITAHYDIFMSTLGARSYALYPPVMDSNQSSVDQDYDHVRRYHARLPQNQDSKVEAGLMVTGATASSARYLFLYSAGVSTLDVPFFHIPRRTSLRVR